MQWLNITVSIRPLHGQWEDASVCSYGSLRRNEGAVLIIRNSRRPADELGLSTPMILTPCIREGEHVQYRYNDHEASSYKILTFVSLERLSDPRHISSPSSCVARTPQVSALCILIV